MKHDSNLGYIFDDKIKDQFVFLIDNDGTKHPKISVKEALEIAESKKLSVVIKVPASEERLAIAMIVDKGKFLFDIKKKEKEKAKLVQSTKVKEITVKPRIGDNDLARFAKNTIDWLADGCQVKFKIKAPGRMQALTDLINQVYEKYIALVGDKGKIQQPLKKLSPVLYSAFLVPNGKK